MDIMSIYADGVRGDGIPQPRPSEHFEADLSDSRRAPVVCEADRSQIGRRAGCGVISG
jgi:hypothetical protein